MGCFHKYLQRSQLHLSTSICDLATVIFQTTTNCLSDRKWDVSFFKCHFVLASDTILLEIHSCKFSQQE